MALYYQWIGHERKQDYIDAINSIENNGYKIQALVLDGGVGLEISKQRHLVQMCQYHFIAIIRRKLTLRPVSYTHLDVYKRQIVPLFDNSLQYLETRYVALSYRIYTSLLCAL